ncbi:germ cell-specific gene 1 protein [Lemur catta]|nr:germ cell-specific gene 1 protein [Lemur catta]
MSNLSLLFQNVCLTQEGCVESYSFLFPYICIIPVAKIWPLVKAQWWWQ